MSSSFVHLHVHSHYSLLEALPKTKNLLKQVKTLNQDTLAITDNGSMYGAMEFYQKAKEMEIKPIFGIDFYLADESRHLKRAKIDTKPYRLVCLAENEQGYRNLIKLSSIGFLEGFYYKPRIDKEILKQHTEGLIALSGGYQGEIEQLLKLDRIDEAKKVIEWYVGAFGKENFYLELVDRPEVAEQEVINTKLVKLSKELNVPVVATKNVFFLKPEDAEAWKILQCIKGGKTLEEFERVTQFDFDASLVSSEYMIERFSDIPEAIENTRKIADRCNVELELGKWNFANFIIEEGKTFREVLTERAFDGLKKKVGELSQVQIDRLNYELEIIDQKGFCPYFLIVSDFLSWSRSNTIVTTTRGSAAGSLVAYATDISAIDPLLYKLPFERFLNPERPSAPDIDADFADNRRDEVLDYVRQKYGTEKVAQICTFGTMLARGSVRDVGRALGFPYAFVDVIAKLVPMGSQGFPMTLERALLESPDLKKKYDEDSNVRRIIDLARQIEGCARHVSIHAAGTVISPTELTDFTPLQIDTREGKMITQYEMKSVEAAGLVKMDFLGIRNLSILGDAIMLVRKIKNIEIDIDRIDVNDQKTFELLAKGNTMGVFQLGGDGMTKYLMELKPERVEDIMAMVALYRPGPIESIPEYIKRKHDPSKIHFLDPRMKEILSMSYGVIVYQDDVMLIAIHLGGYSWLEADKLRKAMGKKIPEEMAKQKIKLHEGLVKNGLSEQKAQELWGLIEPFAAYGFNKCLVGETEIVDQKTGKIFRIEELFKKQKKIFVPSIDKHQKIFSQKVKNIFENGVKEVFELKTRSGKIIEATNNHPFLTFDKWKQLGELKIGERIAVAKSLFLEVSSKDILNFKKCRILGLLIAEGNLCHPHGIYYYSKDRDEIEDFVECADIFENTKTTLNTSKSAISVYVGKFDQKKPNELFNWLAKLNLLGKKAIEKKLPDIVFQMNQDELSHLIAGMWQGDGCVFVDKKGFGQIYYATSSKILAKQLAHLLLRLGIFSTIHTKVFKYREQKKIGYTIHVSHYENVKTFYDFIGQKLLLKKKLVLQKYVDALKKIYEVNENILARGTKDTIPSDVLMKIRLLMTHKKMSIKTMVEKTGLSERLFMFDKRKKGFSRPVLLKIANVLDSKELENLATSQLYWDEIISIKKVGRKMTYDLEMPKEHNFLVNDIFVHNSHAASYGMVAYETAYMKANYPAEYMAALMTAESGDLDKIAEAVTECRRMGIEVLPPDINESLKNFTYINDNTIRFGLLVIKNLGEEVIESILNERKTNGLFKDLADFVGRISHRAFNKKSLEALIKSGALIRFGERNLMVENIDRLLLHNKNSQKEKEQQQQNLFALSAKTSESTFSLRPVNEAPKNQLLAWEKELLGLYVSGHPYEKIHEMMKGVLKLTSEIQSLPVDSFVYVGGIIKSVKEIMTKKGELMAFVELQDLSGVIELIVFSKIYAIARPILKPDEILLVSARVSSREEESKKLLANSFMMISDENATVVKECVKRGEWVSYPQIVETKNQEKREKLEKGERLERLERRGGLEKAEKTTSKIPQLLIRLQGKIEPEKIQSLRECLQQSPGISPVCFCVESGGTSRNIETEYRVLIYDELISQIKQWFGSSSVEIK